MGMILKLAWRNIFRNRRRTILSGLAVGIGLASLMFVDGMFYGMFESMTRNATDSFLGQGQIHARGFLEAYEGELIINDPAAVMSSLQDETHLLGRGGAFAPRTISVAMVTSASDVSSMLMYGIDPAREPALSKVDEGIVEGSYLGHNDRGRILIGDKAAETLGVQVGDRLVVTVAQAQSGELSQELFRVAGIFSFGMREVDSSMAFVHIDTARRMLGLEGAVHEIALRFNDLQLAGDRTLPFWSKYSTAGNEAIGWKDIVPQIESVIEMSKFSVTLTVGLVFAIVALTVINTLFMSLYERMYEFGVLRAVGTRPSQMFMMVVAEAASLAVVSLVIGMALGTGFNWYFSIYGIDYSGIEFAGVTFTEPIRTAIKLEQFTVIPLMVFVFCVIASVYPGIFAARLMPAVAMKKSI